MRVRVLDLDGSITAQQKLLRQFRPDMVSLRKWGPRIRLACRWGRFRKFERALARRLTQTDEPCLNFCGSGDFHHVTLALLRKVPGPVNLLIIDKHPDWMRGVPILHCGTWLHHVSRLPQVRSIFHVGGDLDFDNAYRWLAPVPLLRSGRLTVFPANRRFNGRLWERVPHEPIRPTLNGVMSERRLDRLLMPHRAALASCPLYVSLDKDVLTASEAPVNWDSGELIFDEIRRVLRTFCAAARNQVAGIDVVGDWSPVVTHGWLRSVLHFVEHPSLNWDPRLACQRNEELNTELADLFTQIISVSAQPAGLAA